MARGRALLRNYTPTPEPAEPRPVSLPQMHGNQTMSAPARPDLRRVAEQGSRAVMAEDAGLTAEPVPLAIMGARPLASVRGGRSSATLVPSAFDAHTMGTLSADTDEPWFADDEREDTMDEVMVFEDASLETTPELPRVLDAAVELGVFFAGLTVGLAVQGALAWVAWTSLVG